jgi:hypothetical protein
MTLHDAAMTHFSQWWKRALRAGHAFAEGYALHGKPPERHNAREVRSLVTWSAIIPLAIALAAIVMAIVAPRLAWIASLGLLLYPLQVIRLAMGQKRAGNFGRAILWASFVVLGMFAQLLGVLKYVSSRARGKRSTIIEYKGAGQPVTTK